ncbi:MAG TPA: PLDc N-terminal domain-containing protein [Streptosporangiaceae bacterium]|nr:PLDc N-terminal domain-containing protein [Streptosporangiaceae bacterium]
MSNLLFAASSGPGGPATLLAALVPLLALVIAIDIYCLRDLARARYVRYLPKLVWALIILFVSAPIGALIYLLIGRDRGRRFGAPR